MSSSNSVQVSGITHYRSIQTSDSGCTMLDQGSLASHCSEHVGRHSSALSCHKRPCHGCFNRPGGQGSAMSVFNPWLLRDICCVDKGSLPQSVRQG